MFRRDAQNTAAAGSPSIAGELAWEIEPGGRTAGEIPVLGETAFVRGPDQVVQAIDATTGEEQWRADEGMASLLVLGTDSLLVGWRSRTAQFGFDPRDGSLAWETEVHGGGSWPPVVTEEIIVQSTDTIAPGFQDPPDLAISGLDLETGEVVWEVTPDGVPSGFTVHDGTVYYGTIRNGNEAGYPVARLDPATGERTMLYEAEERVHMVAVTDEYVLLPGRHGVVCLDHAGERVWEASPTGGVDGYPAISDGRVVMGSRAGRIAAFDLETGEEVWEEVVETMERMRSPAVTHDGIYAASGGQAGFLHGLDPTNGSRLWEPVDLEAGTNTHPVVTTAHVLVGTRDGRVLAIE